MKKLICLLLVFFQALGASAWELEGFAGAQTTSYDDVSEANSSGVAARAKINFYTQNRDNSIPIIGSLIIPSEKVIFGILGITIVSRLGRRGC